MDGGIPSPSSSRLMTSSSTAMTSGGGGSYRPWRKILYEHQNYPDNHIADSFLDHLDTTVKTTSSMSLLQTIENSIVIALQITVITLFLTVFRYIENQTITLLGIAFIDILIITLGSLYQVYVLGLFKQSINDVITTCFIFSSCLIIATPIVQSLTANYNKRTINALTVMLSFIHLFFHDYEFINNLTDQFSGNVSLNSSVFISILLASRIESMFSLIFFLLFAVICFILFPECIRFVKQHSLLQYYFICMVLYCTSSILLYFLSRTLLIVYQIVLLVVIFLCPFLLQYMQVYKRPLHGQWDVAPINY